MKSTCVYILQCIDGTLNTDTTQDLAAVIGSHIEGEDPQAYTFARWPVKLVLYESLPEKEVTEDLKSMVERLTRKKKRELYQNHNPIV